MLKHGYHGCSVWHDQTVNQRLAAKIKNFGCYGLVKVRMIFVMNIYKFFFLYCWLFKIYLYVDVIIDS